MTTTRRIVIAVACLTPLGAVLAQDAQEKDDPSVKLYWIFLTTGRSTEGVPVDDVRKMQNAHLANFGRLADEGKLLTAGPMRDPDRVLRGIVIVKAPDISAVNQMFEQDPYVANGYMKVEPHEAKIDHGRIATQVAPESLEEFRIVIISDAKKADDSEREPIEGQAEYVSNLSDAGTIRLAATFMGKGDRRSVWIMKDQDNMKRLVDSSPAIAKGGLEYRVVPLYLVKGTIVAKE